MILMEKINEIWAAITPHAGTPIARRADPLHPLDFFVGYDENQNMQLMLLTDNLPVLPKSSQQVNVRANQRSDGKYAICFVLTNPSLRETFISLCWDIIACTYQCHDKISGIHLAVKRFSMWQALLAKGKETQMSDSFVRGLIGELKVLQDICIPEYGKANAVNGWIGPLQADRDFEFEDIWLEVKTTTLSSDVVSISSLDQLDVERPGHIIICRLEKTSTLDPNAVTLSLLVDSLEKTLYSEGTAQAAFRAKLMLSGYDKDDELANQPMTVHGFEKYRVDDSFPKIVRSQLPEAISSGKYSLSVSALQSWRIE